MPESPKKARKKSKSRSPSRHNGTAKKPTSSQLTTTTPAVAKRIRVYRNGDKFHKGIVVVLNIRHIHDINALLDAISERVGLVGGAKKLYTINGTLVKTTNELENNHEYVASSGGFMAVPYGQAYRDEQVARLPRKEYSGLSLASRTSKSSLPSRSKSTNELRSTSRDVTVQSVSTVAKSRRRQKKKKKKIVKKVKKPKKEEPNEPHVVPVPLPELALERPVSRHSTRSAHSAQNGVRRASRVSQHSDEVISDGVHDTTTVRESTFEHGTQYSRPNTGHSARSHGTGHSRPGSGHSHRTEHSTHSRTDHSRPSTGDNTDRTEHSTHSHVEHSTHDRPGTKNSTHSLTRVERSTHHRPGTNHSTHEHSTHSRTQRTESTRNEENHDADTENDVISDISEDEHGHVSEVSQRTGSADSRHHSQASGPHRDVPLEAL
ncbi:unnamed protein product [Bursaphelenchus okinawaensis]|uniref:Doublecortin domain-containing protein n=1 Tax=Bursaphelenchus okinawaensis TaxID=465554 RepID=A0A811KCE1_9BILA|nr:unnamed protein product [Bursaphelenchus okinawaensis]CAG9098728.1 unnamed protein product [Bursaphelenchus okinawaensis]